MNARADFEYHLTRFEGKPTLLIRDLNLGGCSITNNIENVVGEIAEAAKISPEMHIILYRDSLGQWTWWNYLTNVFSPVPTRLGRFLKAYLLFAKFTIPAKQS